MPRWVIVALAVVAAIPAGWELGVAVAYLVAGPAMGVLPVLTIPFGLIAAVGFALTPWVQPATRLSILVAGTVLFILVSLVLA